MRVYGLGLMVAVQGGGGVLAILVCCELGKRPKGSLTQNLFTNMGVSESKGYPKTEHTESQNTQ